MSYNVKLDAFEGPLDLLLYLIKQSKLEITDISMADITYQYMEYISQAQDNNMDLTSEFLVTAATLIEIKSRLLLPNPPKAGENEQVDDADPEQRLKARLQIYSAYKEAAAHLRTMEQCQEMVFTGPVRYVSKPEPIRIIEINASAEDLFNCYHRLLNRIKPVAPYNVKAEAISLNRQINIFKRLLSLFERIRFGRIVARYRFDKAHVVVSFLSVLELMKSGEADAYQSKPFAELIINRIKRRH
ncbi:segregation and condensation protein A [Mahella australiensis]|uniref:Segregation and condensation protein A n=1 Tax=Mahella australiensis (strain DSM 15567 / CIP 107919 / 50-1 BON) TaxID=697281 RepID=F3ZXW8_MAHA5|nr:segregation/condensation protein A [Mahella australiensis]AEE96638.1 chromosome segregation and condensation protein ScpA [Mahella australiensis 50-1 BON]